MERSIAPLELYKSVCTKLRHVGARQYLILLNLMSLHSSLTFEFGVLQLMYIVFRPTKIKQNEKQTKGKESKDSKDSKDSKQKQEQYHRQQ